MKKIYNKPTFKIYEGESLRDYPNDIKRKDHTYWIETIGKYLITFEEQLILLKLILNNKVRDSAFKEYCRKVINIIKELWINRNIDRDK